MLRISISACRTSGTATVRAMGDYGAAARDGGPVDLLVILAAYGLVWLLFRFLMDPR